MATIVKEVIKMEPIFANWTGQSTNPDCFSLTETTSIDTLSYPKIKCQKSPKPPASNPPKSPDVSASPI
jgi:hypothetical protein